MRPASPALFPVFRSALTVSVLTLFFVGQGEHSVNDVAAATGVQRQTIWRELARLEESSLITSRTVGGAKLYTANVQAPFYAALRDLVTIVAGPSVVLAEELAGVTGIDLGLVFGSWASRYHGDRGSSPNDIDVLIVGSADRDDVYEAAGRAQLRVGREVNPVVVSSARWLSATDPLMRDIRAKPLVVFVGSLDESATP
jgi:hypothetical protein